MLTPIEDFVLNKLVWDIYDWSTYNEALYLINSVALVAVFFVKLRFHLKYRAENKTQNSLTISKQRAFYLFFNLFSNTRKADANYQKLVLPLLKKVTGLDALCIEMFSLWREARKVRANRITYFLFFGKKSLLFTTNLRHRRHKKMLFAEMLFAAQTISNLKFIIHFNKSRILYNKLTHLLVLYKQTERNFPSDCFLN